MRSYRLYFRDEAGRICGREDFEAPDDRTALSVATIVFEACSDRSADFDLWRGTDAVRDERPTPQTLAETMDKWQSTIAGLEERIRDSGWTIATSQQLLHRLECLYRGDDR